MNKNPEPGTLNPELDQDSRMISTYSGVLALEAVIIVALWLFGRMFA